MALQSLFIVSVPVTDQDRSKAFYAEKLGFGVRADNLFGQLRWVQLQPPGGGTSITLVTWFPTMPPGSLRGLVIECDDIQETAAELSRRGVTLNEDIQDAPWGKFTSVDDPDGNGWVIQQTYDRGNRTSPQPPADS
jgi:catechol 2,3-dioxygenase-like lactoylglutathione lyase family enzyme